MMEITRKLCVALATVALAACSNTDIPSASEEMENKNEIRIASRVADGTFKENEHLGVYVVNYENGAPGSLKGIGNYVDNSRFTFSFNEWVSDEVFYWKDNQTLADFYAYYPFADCKDARTLPFSVMADQRTEGGFRASDFLWGKAEAQHPSTKRVQFTLNHLMSRLIIELRPGKGFTADDLASSKVALELKGICLKATIDLADGNVSTVGTTGAIKPNRVGDLKYQALVVPQVVEKTEMILVHIDGDTFYLTKGMKLDAGKQYTLTVTVSKNTSGIDVQVGDWEIVDGDFGGTATK